MQTSRVQHVYFCPSVWFRVQSFNPNDVAYLDYLDINKDMGHSGSCAISIGPDGGGEHVKVCFIELAGETMATRQVHTNEPFQKV